MERARTRAGIFRTLSLLASFGFWALVPAQLLGADREFGVALGSAILFVFLVSIFAAALSAAALDATMSERDRSSRRFAFLTAHLMNFCAQIALAAGFVYLVERVFR